MIVASRERCLTPDMPGQKIALVGESGVGKTTLMNLIPRFADPSSGRITVDGYDLREVTQSSLRRQIGQVFQDSFLFSGSAAENIRFGRPEATDAEVEAAAMAAQAHEFILEFPDGYSTQLGERGVRRVKSQACCQMESATAPEGRSGSPGFDAAVWVDLFPELVDDLGDFWCHGHSSPVL